MLAKAYSATPRGVDALFVTVEVDRIRAQHPSVIVVGLPDTAVREARERIFAAIRHLGRRSEPANVVINLAPADQRKEGAVLDLANREILERLRRPGGTFITARSYRKWLEGDVT